MHFCRVPLGVALISWCVTGTPVTGLSADVPPPKPCRIEVIDQQLGWPVPLIQLRTTHLLTFVSDNAGVIALDTPELLGRDIWFDVIGHGYEVPKDGFGLRGVRLHPESGGRLTVKVTRVNIAKRLGRATGAGLFAESQKFGEELGWREISGVFGCDSVQNAVHRGRLYWAWGDTILPHYPLGVFDMSSATTAIQPLKSFTPPLRLEFQYFKDKNGRPRGVAPMPGSGPTWLDSYVSLPDVAGVSHLCAKYVKIRNHLEEYEAGLCVWNESDEKFDRLKVLWKKENSSDRRPPSPGGHPAFWKEDQGKEWVLFGNPLPKLRCPATFEAWQDPKQWEELKSPEALLAAGTTNLVQLHSGSMAWNPYRRRWVTVFMQSHGQPSPLGEIWYAESRNPLGPWGPAVKVLTHDNYTFYNPRIHPEFTANDSPILIFEGTYTQQFLSHPQPTPRYDYNQIVYRLDLDDPGLAPAQQP